MKAQFPCVIVVALASLAFTMPASRGGDPASSSTTKESTTKPDPKIYYTTQWVKVEDDSGVTDVPIDTKVTCVGKAVKDHLKVKTAENLVFEVSPDQITDDPAKAAALARQEADAKAARDAAAAQAALQSATAAPTPPQFNLAVVPTQTPPPSTGNSGGLSGT